MQQLRDERSGETFKAIFFFTKKLRKKKKNRINIIFFSTSAQVCWGASIPYFNFSTLLFCYPLFFDKYLNPSSLFRIFVEFSLKTCMFHQVWGKFQIYGVQITRKCNCESKNWIETFFTHPSPRKTSPPSRENHSFLEYLR